MVTQKLGLAVGTHLLITAITIPKKGCRSFVLLPDEGRKDTLVLWVSASDEEEHFYVKAAKALACQILMDAQKRLPQVERLRLRFD